MATGKSAVGRIVAAQSNARFFDLDEEIERRALTPISQIFSERGEEAFRVLEKKVLLELLSAAKAKKTVISLGGGALLDRKFRIEVLGASVVVTLTAQPDEIFRRARLQDDVRGDRPLLRGPEPRARVIDLLEKRALVYAECHGSVSTDAREPRVIAKEVISLWEKNPVAVASGFDSYAVLIGSAMISDELPGLVGKTSGVLLVSDSNVDPLHGEKARAGLAPLGVNMAQSILTPGEEHKNLEALRAIYQTAFDEGMDRSSTFVGLGGGVVTDMTGFAAATWVRGVRWIGLPTTLLAMVDASVGGKTAVDFHSAKNSVGAFWQPQSVICDIDTLQTETERQYVGALSEVVKTALVGDGEMLDFLEDNAEALLQRDPATVAQVVERCVRVKARVVALDERESGIRACLNFGHTIGHALESSGGYSALTHGEAVSLGIVAALRLGEKKGHTPAALTKRILELLKKLKLPHQLKRADLQESTALLGHDKKRAGEQIQFVYAAAPGDVFTESIQLKELEVCAVDLADR